MSELPFLRDLVVIFSVAVAVVVLLRRFGVPSIAGFILAGVAVGPHALGLVSDVHQVEVLAEVGVALLLFGIGLELNLASLQRLWRAVAVGGALQVGLSVAIVVAAGSLFGLEARRGLFLGFLVAVSSTAIVLRGLDARGETDAPHGRFTLGILIFQDLAVVPMMLAIPLLAGAAEPGAAAALALVETAAILTAVVAGAWILVPRLLHWIARTRQRELWMLTVFLISMGTAWIASLAGVSLALGAFLAGLVVSGSEFRHQALSDLIPLREVLTSLFFVSVGMLLDPRGVGADAVSVLGLLAVILVGKFVVVFLVGTAMRMSAQVNAIAALALCQVGEFSFVLLRAAEGRELLPPALASRFLAVAILSMLVTPLALAAGPRLAAGAGRLRLLRRLLGVPTAFDAGAERQARADHVLIAGYGVAGRELARALRDLSVPYVVVDLNPDLVRRARQAGEPVYFGDVTSVDVLRHLGAARAREVVLVIDDPSAAARAISAVRQVAPEVHLIVRAPFVEDVERLEAVGATQVVPAELEAAVEVATHVLGRHGARPEDIEAERARIRTRRREDEV